MYVTQSMRHLVNEPEVVADEDHAAVKVVDGVGEGVDGLHVEMVGGLVQQQHVRHLPRQPGEHHAALLPVRQLLDRRSLGLASDAVPSYHLDRGVIFKSSHSIGKKSNSGVNNLLPCAFHPFL